MSSTTVDHAVASLADSLSRTQEETGIFAETSQRLRRLVPFDGSAWFATDPATVLATNPVRIENVENGHCGSYWEREHLVEDALLFRDLARTEAGAATLYGATDERPMRSARYREFLAPQGYGDELRAVFRLGDATWGVVDLFREQGRARFTAADVAMVQRIGPAVAAALRGLAMTARVSSQAMGDGPGTALFERDGTLVSLDERAESLFREVAGPRWSEPPPEMTPIRAVVSQAVAVDEGRARGPASGRLRGTTGRWLSVHASCLRRPDGAYGLTALTIEPAKSAQIAPIIVEAYCLTPREQEITRLVARGLSNQEIAVELFLSPHTVRDHLKAVFGKVGVGSRGELVAKLFAEHYAPPMHTPGAPVEHVIL